MQIQGAVEAMKKYYEGDSSQIDHSMKVLKTAIEVSEKENIDSGFLYNVIALSSIFHDIGIPEARRKYNSSAPMYQEMEGPAVARDLMIQVGIRPDIAERACYIVGNHHTFEAIDGIDFQILFEADIVANLAEGWSGLDKDIIRDRIDKGLFTSSGAEIIIRHL